MRLFFLFYFVIAHVSVGFSQTVTNFPITPDDISLRNLPKGFISNIFGFITFPSQGYWVEEIGIESNIEKEEITLVLHIAHDPFHTYPSEESVMHFTRHFELPFDIVNPLHEYVSYRQQMVDVYTDISPLQNNFSNTLSISTVPNEVNAGKVFRLSYKGAFPTAGYEILRRYAYYADGTFIMNMIVDEPEVGAEVITPFEVQQWVNGVEPGEYPVVWYINSEMINQSTIQIGDYDPPMNEFNEYGAYFNVVPITNAYIRYTSGIETHLLQRDEDVFYRYSEFSLNTVSFPMINIERLNSSLPPNYDRPYGRIDNYGVGFSSSSGNDFYRGTLDGQQIHPRRIITGNHPTHQNLINEVIYYEYRDFGNHFQTGWVKIDSIGNYVVQNKRNLGTFLTGTLQNSMFSHIQNMFVDADLINRDFYFGPFQKVGPGLPFPQRPPDSYIMAYDDVAVNVAGRDYAPDDLNEIINTMNAMIQGTFQTSNVDLWELYN